MLPVCKSECHLHDETLSLGVTCAAKPAAGYTTEDVPMVMNRSHVSNASAALPSTSPSKFSPNLHSVWLFANPIVFHPLSCEMLGSLSDSFDFAPQSCCMCTKLQIKTAATTLAEASCLLLLVDSSRGVS